MLEPAHLTPAQQRAWDRETARLELAALIRAETLFCPVPCASDGWTDTRLMSLEAWAGL